MKAPGVTHGSSFVQSRYRRPSKSESFGNFAVCLNWSSHGGGTTPSPYTPRLVRFTSPAFAIRESPRGTPEKRPMRDTSKPANGIRQDKVVITHDRSLRQCKTSQDSAVIGYSDNTWAEDMAPQGCDQSADPAAGNAWAAQAASAAFLAGKR